MKESIRTDDAPAPVGPYSQAIRNGNLLFLSGQLPIDPKDGSVVTGAITDQAVLVMNNIKAVAEAAGAGLKDVVKTTIFLTDLADFAAVNEVYAGYFHETPPARSCVQVAALPKGAGIEIEALIVQ